MDDDPRPTRPLRARVWALGGWLDASPAEALGLAVLLTGAVAATAVLWWAAQPRPATPGDVPAPAVAALPSVAPTSGGVVTHGRAVVHVAGAVSAPGVVELRAGARVAEAVAAAGGPLSDADLSALNLARPVTDGELVVVPRVGDAPPTGPVATAGAEVTGAGAALPDGRLDLNRATIAELDELPGLGPVLAQRIVDHRDANGRFTEVGQLRDVSGIGEKRFQDLADLVAVP